jgi:hypothetical protein
MITALLVAWIAQDRVMMGFGAIVVSEMAACAYQFRFLT